MGLFGPDIKGMKKRQDFDALINCLKDSHASVRSDACIALGELQNNRAVGPLIESLKDPNLDVRTQAIIALDTINDPLSLKPATEAIQALVDFYFDGNEASLIGESLKKIGEPALKILNQTKISRSEKDINPLLISHVKKILGNKPVDAIAIAYGSVDSSSASLFSDLIYMGLMGPSYGKRLAPKKYKANLILISINNDELSLISIGKMYLESLSIDPILALLPLNTVISNDIQTYPIKKITINYDEKNNSFIVKGALNASLFIPDFVDYSNLFNVPKIFQVVNNEKT
jgi:hypothetical protein